MKQLKYIKKFQTPSSVISQGTGKLKTLEEHNQDFLSSKPKDLNKIVTETQSKLNNFSTSGNFITDEKNKIQIKERGEVEKQKAWLHNWYQKRLPAINKQHLGAYVSAGLTTPYRDYVQTYNENLNSNINAAEYKADSTKSSNPVGILAFGNNNLGNAHINFYESVLDNSNPIHEFTHAIQYGGSSKINPEFYNNYRSTSGENYFKNPQEQHARINEIRYKENLNPTKTDYTLDDIKKFEQNNSQINLNELRKGGMSDADIVNALNTWAYNPNKNNNVWYVKQGGSIKNTKK